MFNFPVIRAKLRETLEFVKLLRVEPYLLLIAFQGALKGPANGQMVEDKICSHWFNTTEQYCHDLPSSDDEGFGPMHYKSKVLANAAKFGSYDTYVTAPPALIWALFAGNWIDRYPHARKLLMYMAIIASIIEGLIALYLSIQWKTSIYYNLVLHVPISILGGTVGAGIAIQHYMTTTTPLKYMAIRFLIWELCWTIASPIGSALGGYILVQKPLFHSYGEIRNYSTVYIAALAIELIGLLWVIFMINEKVARKQLLKIQPNDEGIATKERDGTQIKLNSDISTDVKNPLRLLFDLENVKSMFRMILKKRPNKARTQLILFNLCLIIFILNGNGGGVVWGQFVQMVYLWPPDWTAYIGAIGSGLASLSTLIIVPVLINIFKLRDVSLSLIGFVAMFTVAIIKGTWYSELACYISMPISAVTGLSAIACKSHMTKIIDRDEVGKMMSFKDALTTLVPIFTSTCFVYIFECTIDTYPGTIFQLIAIFVTIPIFILIWVDLCTEPINYDDQDDGRNKQSKRNSYLNIENNNESDVENKYVLE